MVEVSKSNRGRRKRGKSRVGESGKDIHLETFHVYFEPRVLLCSMSFVTVSTEYVKRQRGIQYLQKAPLRHSLDTLMT